MSAPKADELDLRLLHFRKSPAVAEGIDLAEALVAASRERDAISVYDLLRKSAPRDASLSHRAGRVLLGLGDLPAAQAILLEALQIAPDDASIAASLGEVLLKRGEPGRAKELLARHRGDPAVDKLYGRAERLARLSADVDPDPAPLVEPAAASRAASARPHTQPFERDTAPPAGPTAEDAEGFFEDQPTAMIDRSQLEELRAARASAPEGAPAPAAPAPISPPDEGRPTPAVAAPPATDADDTRQVEIPLPEPETRSWSGVALEDVADAVLEEPHDERRLDDGAPRRPKKGRGALALVAVFSVVVLAAAGAYFGRGALVAGSPEQASSARAEADRIFRAGEPSEFERGLAKLEEASAIAPAEGEAAAIEAFGRVVALLELEEGDGALARTVAQRVEGPLRDALLAAVDFAATREAPLDTSLPLPSKALDPRASYLLGRLRQAAGVDPSVDFELAARADATGVPAAVHELALHRLARGDRAAAAELVGDVPEGARAAMLRLLARPEVAAPDALAAASPSPFDRFLGALVRAELHLAGGRPEEARAQLAGLEPSVARGPLGPQLAARVARRAGDLELARKLAGQALDLGADDAARVLAVEIAVAAGDLERAREVLGGLTGETAISLALDLARRTGKSEDVARARELLSSDEVGEARAAAHRLSLALLEGAPDEVLDRLAEPLAGAEDGHAYVALAELALSRDDAERALELAAKGSELVPSDVVADRVAGIAALLLGDAARASAALERAAERGDVLAAARLAELRLAEGRGGDAAALVSADLVARLPEGERLAAQRTRALALAEAGDLEAAREALDALEGADDEETLAVRARVGILSGDPSATLEALRPRIEPLLAKRKAEPEDAPLLVAFARALEASDDGRDSGSVWQLAVRSEPTDIEARIGYSRALIRARKEAHALRVMDRADNVLAERGELDARPTELLLLRGRALLELGKRGDAASFLEQAAAREDAPPETYFYLGEALAGRKSAESRAAYERYLALEPDGAHKARAERAIQR